MSQVGDAPWRSLARPGCGALRCRRTEARSFAATRRQAALIITGSPKERRVNKKFSAQQMASIRQTLCDERFVDLEDAYGPLVIHGGWSTLTVIAGEHINKRIRFNSTWTWATSKEKDELAKAAPALRIWLRCAKSWIRMEKSSRSGKAWPKHSKRSRSERRASSELSGTESWPQQGAATKTRMASICVRLGPHAEVDYLG